MQYTYVYGAEDAYAYCQAYAGGGAWASAASDQAVVIKKIWENTCNPLSWAATGHADFDETVTAWAKAYVKVRTRGATQPACLLPPACDACAQRRREMLCETAPSSAQHVCLFPGGTLACRRPPLVAACAQCSR